MPTAIAAAVSYIVASVSVSTLIKVGLALATQFLGSKPKTGATGRKDVTLMVRESAFPRREIYGRARVGGIWIYADTTGSENNNLYLALGICDGPIDGVEAIMFGEEALVINEDGTVGGNYSGKVIVNIYDGTQTTADPMLLANTANWSANHILNGIAYATFKLTYSTSKFPNGLPEISFIVRGRNDIYDPRTDTSGYTDNPALCLNHFLTLSKWGAKADYATEIDEAFLIASANICEEQVDTLSGPENRYAISGVITSEITVEDNIALIRQCMAGWVVYSGGKFRISAGAYEAPTFTITPEMIMKVNGHKTKKPRRERVNMVKGVYTAEENRWQESDFPPITNATYKAADGGDELPKDLELPLVQSPSLAQRLAKIELETGRLERIINLECSLRALPVVAGASVMVDFPRYSYEGKVFQCISSEIKAGTSGAAPTISLELREWSSNIYAWDYSTEEKEVKPSPGIGETGPKLDRVQIVIKRNGVIKENFTDGEDWDNYIIDTDYDDEVTLELACLDEPDAYIGYSIGNSKGAHPKMENPKLYTQYTGPIVLKSTSEFSATRYVQVRAAKDGFRNSDLTRFIANMW